MLRLALLLAALSCGPVLAQSGPAVGSLEPVPFLLINQERLFAESRFGKAAIARLQEGEQTLVAENLRIEAALEAEERDLTDRRAVLSAEEFRALADAFDEKVEGVRAAQRTKYLNLTALHEGDKGQFLNLAKPIIGQLMQEMGAVAVIDEATVFLFLQRIEVTDLAIQRIDAAIGDGSAAVAPAPAPAPAPVQP